MRHLKLVIASSLLGTMLLAAPAFADIAPQDSCIPADAGKACNNAGDNADQPGTCQKDTCTRATPSGPMTYDCYLCKPDTAGAGGNGGAGAAEPMSEAGAPVEGGAKADGGSKTDAGTNAAGGTKSTGGTSASAGAQSASSKDKSGCALVSAPASSLAGLLAPLAAFGLALARRRARRG